MGVTVLRPAWSTDEDKAAIRAALTQSIPFAVNVAFPTKPRDANGCLHVKPTAKDGWVWTEEQTEAVRGAVLALDLHTVGVRTFHWNCFRDGFWYLRRVDRQKAPA